MRIRTTTGHVPIVLSILIICTMITVITLIITGP